MPWQITAVFGAALLLALAIDVLWGEPPAPLHPVVWMGKALQGCGERIAPLQPVVDDYKSFWLAALAWCALAAIVLVVTSALQWAAWDALPPWGVALALGLMLKPLLSWRMLRDEVQAVEQALAQSLPAGRERLAWLVSRDTAELDAQAVREAAIETLAENLNDSVVAPLFWFALLGLPGAALYRFANTADAMWGYPGMRNGRYWQWAGKWAARADDVLSWLPARLTALLLALAARRWPQGLAAQARKTPSPNSGWPMAAMALLLGLRLSKPGVYQLNASGQAPSSLGTRRALALSTHAVWLLAVSVPAAMLALTWALL